MYEVVVLARLAMLAIVVKLAQLVVVDRALFVIGQVETDPYRVDFADTIVVISGKVAVFLRGDQAARIEKCPFCQAVACILPLCLQVDDQLDPLFRVARHVRIEEHIKRHETFAFRRVLVAAWRNAVRLLVHLARLLCLARIRQSRIQIPRTDLPLLHALAFDGLHVEIAELLHRLFQDRPKNLPLREELFRRLIIGVLILHIAFSSYTYILPINRQNFNLFYAHTEKLKVLLHLHYSTHKSIIQEDFVIQRKTATG